MVYYVNRNFEVSLFNDLDSAIKFSESSVESSFYLEYGILNQTDDRITMSSLKIVKY